MDNVTLWKMSDLFLALEAGREVLMNGSRSSLNDHFKDYDLSAVDEHIEEGNYTLAPEPKKIDLSFLIGSGIDCEVRDDYNHPWGIHELSGYSDGHFKCDDGVRWVYCRPRMNKHMSMYEVKDMAWEKLNRYFDVKKLTQHTYTVYGTKDGYTL